MFLGQRKKLGGHWGRCNRDSRECVSSKERRRATTCESNTRQTIAAKRSMLYKTFAVHLGKPAIEALKVVILVKPLQKADVVKQFPDVFGGLGQLKDDYVIQLRENATPFALTTPRRVPIPLLPKVKEELQRMERLGVITKIEDPTDWCAGMVVAKLQGEDLCGLDESE